MQKQHSENTKPALLGYNALEFYGKAVKKLTICGEDVSVYTIVYGENCLPAERTAARELQKYLLQATGTKLKLAKDSEPKNGREIIVGNTLRNADEPEHESECFTIRTCENGDLVICGGGTRGTIYGVYEFLEKYIGWMFLAEDCEVINPSECISLGEINDSQKPGFEQRDSFWWDYFPEKISVKRKLNNCHGHRRISEAFGGEFGFTGSFAHTIGGYTGIGGQGQPCLSDPEVLKKTIAAVRGILKEHPDANIISVSQNDNSDYCKCEKCAAIDEEEGSHAGTMLRFVNAVADDIKDDYPNVKLHTFAYVYTRKPPKHVVPRDNVLVQLCTIECCFDHPLNDPDCENNRSLVEDLEGWCKLSDHLYIWDYTVNFSHYACQLANLETIPYNIRFFKAHNVTGMFEQGEYQSPGAGLSVLNAYLIAKMLWNPDMSDAEVEDCIVGFCRGYYGDAWKYMYEYAKFITECGKGMHSRIFSSPDNVFSKEKFQAGEKAAAELFRKAREAAGEDEKLLSHIGRTEVQFDYVRLCLKHGDIAALAESNPAEYEKRMSEYRAEAERLVRAMIRYGIKIREWNEIKVSEGMFEQSPQAWC
ncbi:MAG: DUF4838 domain-containing protein [Firmicutes bacterium]|nr:DUF4838 domain-containing protein [Bacillota bacterium]